MNSATQLDRLRGCLFGGALGDTIGLFTEFLSAERARDIYGAEPVFTLLPRPTIPNGNGKTRVALPAAAAGPDSNLRWCHMDDHRALFEPSAWTDDTDQTLLILLSFLRSGGKDLDAIDFAKRLRGWLTNGLRALDRPPLGIGRTIGGVVGGTGYLNDPIGAARE
jgi:ADP-ribosylglycohydrolase